MKYRLLLALVSMSVLSLFACRREVVVIETAPATPVSEPVAKTKTLETSRLGTAIDNYEQEPTAAHLAEVKKTLARLDEEIAELQVYVAKHEGDERARAAVKLKNMQSYRAAETVRFTAAQAKGTVDAPKAIDDRTGAEKAEEGARKVGNSIQEAGRKTGEAIKDAVRPN